MKGNGKARKNKKKNRKNKIKMPQTNMTSTPLRTHFSILRILVLPHFRLSRNTVKSLCQKTLAVISAFRLFTAFVFPSTKFSLKNHKQAKM